jgi:chemotaxis protein MotA
MDLATVIGLVGAFGLIIAAMAMGVGIGPYIDIPSVLIVVVGSIMALFIANKMDMMTKFAKVFMIAIKPCTCYTSTISNQFVESHVVYHNIY